MSGSEVRTICWTSLRCNSQALPILRRAKGTERELDAMLVIPANVGIQLLHELLDRRIHFAIEAIDHG